MMSQAKINATIADRFARWGNFLRSERATPLLIVGLKMPDNKLVITTTEDLRNDEVALLLAEAITMICPGGVNS